MIRFVPGIIVMLVAFATSILVTGFVTRAELLSDDAVMLWVSAITAGDGEMPVGRIVAAYPAIPFLTTTALEFLSPRGTAVPLLLTSGILALIASAWLAAFRRIGLPLSAAIAASLLLALHPALLRAAIAGPAEMFFAAFLFLLCVALYDLRARSSAPEVMTVALALLALAFSHPMGAAIACGLLPLLILALRPEMLASSVVNLVVAIIFPTVFCIGSFVYMSWVFPGSGWSFLVSPAEGLATWAVGFSRMFGHGFTGWIGFDAAIAAAIALVLAAPLIPMAIVWVRRRRPLVMPAIIIAIMTIAAVWITVASGLFGDPASVAIVAPILAATMIIRLPVVGQRLTILFPLLVVGWIGGLVALAIIDPAGTANLLTALEGGNVNQERLDAIKLGNATAEREGILVDTLNAPAVVLGREKARGLLSPSNEEFTLDVLFSRIDTPFVAVPNPEIGLGAQDRLNKAFPLLYRNGSPDYHLIYENPNWKLFARN